MKLKIMGWRAESRREGEASKWQGKKERETVIGQYHQTHEQRSEWRAH